MIKEQLEEVWEDQDHMDPQDFDPKTFFMMHDLDGNGQWDETEVRILFKKELDKVYDPNAPEDDMREREEEMERMREHVFKESDTNKDRMISYDEFLVWWDVGLSVESLLRLASIGAAAPSADGRAAKQAGGRAGRVGRRVGAQVPGSLRA